MLHLKLVPFTNGANIFGADNAGKILSGKLTFTTTGDTNNNLQKIPSLAKAHSSNFDAPSNLKTAS